ncbi:MAG TPA: GTP-binding protein [Chitinophagaceae bacterium]|nr:GTP-binding protein [Chitinophagaceae bacterium]
MRFFLVGGFLGSGKTTAIVNACQHLIKKGQRVAVITNDQGEQQVDNAYVKSFGIPCNEVANGCFCCNYDQLDKHIHLFIENNQPDIIFAESVGSCTDLVATVTKPFVRDMPGCSVVISVFADATLFLSLFEGRVNFISENVQYIYKKQLEETDVLVINKIDLLSPSQVKTINKHLTNEFPDKTILYQSSFEENNIEKWIETLEQFEQVDRLSLDIDYDLYGDGEAQLAWLDESLTIISSQKNAVVIAKEIIAHIDHDIKEKKLTIGHLKFFIETTDPIAIGWKKKISITNVLPISFYKPEENDAGEVHLLINARVQTEPEILQQMVNDTLKQMVQKHDCNIMVEKWSAFKPGYPKPTHRIS